MTGAGDRRSPPVVDALGHAHPVGGEPPRRVVSLVPSETDSVAALAGVDRLVGRTVYCEEPRGAIEGVPTVGGTKNVDVAAVAELAPDLVLANKEENGRPAVEKLLDAGLPVHVSFPRTVDQAVAHVRDLARLLGVDPAAHPAVRRLEAAYLDAQAARAAAAAGSLTDAPPRVFVPIWKDPWMTFDGRAYASDLLELAGFRNAFSDRPRRYPLAADLGRRPAAEGSAGDRDTRYPRIRLAEVAERDVDLILLPDEPYAFDEAARDALLGEPDLAETPAVRRGAVRLVSGKDLFWYGARTATALASLRRLSGG